MSRVDISKYLLEILKTGQYLGNEISSVHKRFFLEEWEKAKKEALTLECREQCSVCPIRERFPKCLKIYE